MASEGFNPYAAPGSSAEDEPAELYRIDYRRLSYRELWKVSRGLTSFTFLGIYKIFHLPLKLIAQVPIARDFGGELLCREDVPAEVWEGFREALRDLDEAGMSYVHTMRGPAIHPKELNLVIAYLSEDGMEIAGCSYCRPANATHDHAASLYSVTSRLADGRSATTYTGGAYLEEPTLYLHNPVPPRSMSGLLKTHREWVASLGIPTDREDPDRIRERSLAISKAEFEERVRRKIYVPIPSSEAQAIRRALDDASPSTQLPATSVDRYLGVALLCIMFVGATLGLLRFFWPNRFALPCGFAFLLFLPIYAIQVSRQQQRTRRLKEVRSGTEEEIEAL